jgi:hemerythrin
MTIEWTKALSTGVEEIDAQHRELFKRAGRLVAGLGAGEKEDVGALLGYLHQYAVSHFGAEEAQMRGARFPGYVRHKAEHDRFIEDLLDLTGEYEKKGKRALVALKASGWLSAWLREHVSGTDAELGKFLLRRAG